MGYGNLIQCVGYRTIIDGQRLIPDCRRFVLRFSIMYSHRLPNPAAVCENCDGEDDQALEVILPDSDKPSTGFIQLQVFALSKAHPELPRERQRL